ncbi:MAG TPA: hypothetical protein VFP78_02090 [Solirubrobacteraceae bacterium]|nr:hypothetical protein [Solirubrobacteraceae bacterium]
MPPDEPKAAEGNGDPAPAVPEAPATETPEATAEAPAPETSEVPEPQAPPAAEAPAAEPSEPQAPPAAEEPAAEPQQTASEAPAAEPPARPDRGGKGERPRRRRRLTAAERHRRTFFAKLTELRKQEQAAVEANELEPEPAAAEEPAAEAPAEGAPAQEAPATPAPQPSAGAPATSPSRSARAQARLVAAIERVGGAESVREALQPKRRDDGETMKWSSVCAEQAAGHKPGDPVFTAWVRLAATPVRDVKAIVNPRASGDDRRGGRGGGGRGRRSDRPGGGGGGYRGDRGDRDRGRPARREELEEHGRDGAFRSSVRIVHVDSEGQRKDRDDERRAEREAKRQAEAERLAKLGY